MDDAESDVNVDVYLKFPGELLEYEFNRKIVELKFPELWPDINILTASGSSSYIHSFFYFRLDSNKLSRIFLNIYDIHDIVPNS